MFQDDEQPQNESQGSRFTEVISFLFVTIVMVFLYIKMIFF